MSIITLGDIKKVVCRNCFAVKAGHMPDGACFFGSSTFEPDIDLSNYFEHQRTAFFSALGLPPEMLNSGHEPIDEESERLGRSDP